MGGKSQEHQWAFLMCAANEGDAEACRLRAFARRGLARAGMADTDAEDIVQEALLAIHLKRQSWDQDAPVGPWIRAIARHKMIDCCGGEAEGSRFGLRIFRSDCIR